MKEDKEFAILVSESDIHNFDFAEEIKKELEKRGSQAIVMHLYPRMEMDEIIDCLKDSFWPSNWIIIGEATTHIEPNMYNFMFVNPVFDRGESFKAVSHNDMVSKIVDCTGKTIILSHDSGRRFALFSNADDVNEKAFAERYPGYPVEILTDSSYPSVIADKAIEFFIDHETFDMKRETTEKEKILIIPDFKGKKSRREIWGLTTELKSLGYDVTEVYRPESEEIFSEAIAINCKSNKYSMIVTIGTGCRLINKVTDSNIVSFNPDWGEMIYDHSLGNMIFGWFPSDKIDSLEVDVHSRQFSEAAFIPKTGIKQNESLKSFAKQIDNLIKSLS